MGRRRQKQLRFVNLMLFVRLFVRKYLLLFLVLVGVLLVMTDRLNYSIADRISQTVTHVTSPFLEATNWVSDKYDLGKAAIVDWLNTYHENERLRAENERLRALKYHVSALQIENQRLREIVKLIPDVEYDFVTVPVIGNSKSVFDHSLYAKTKGVIFKKNAVVTALDNIIGRVISSDEDLTHIQLVTDIDSRVPVVTSDSRTRAVLTGVNREEMVLRHVPTKHEIVVGERVLSSGDVGVFPAGVLVGEVSYIDGEAIYVKPYVRATQVDYVQIVK